MTDPTAQKSVLKICVHLCPICGFSFLISLVFSAWFAIAVGRNLGLFFGGLILASILTPLLVIAESGLGRRVSMLVGIVVAVAMVWLSCVLNDAITLWEWARAAVVLASFALAAAGVAALLAKIHVPP